MFWTVTLDLLKGFGTTCSIFALTLALALPLGLAISFGTMSKFRPIKMAFKTFVWIIRGVPLMLQVIIVFYVPGFVFGAPLFTRLGSVVAAFVINYACYFSEIYRGGIESIPRGEAEIITANSVLSRINLPNLKKLFKKLFKSYCKIKKLLL